MQVAASLLQIRCLTVVKLMSGCICITCFSLKITSLPQVVNRLDARLFAHKLDASCFNNLSKSANIKVDQVILLDLMELDEANRTGIT